MRILLIALQQTTEGPASPEEQRRWPELGAPMRNARIEEDHVLALATAMRDGGRLAPMLLCRNHSRLHSRAKALNLPTLTTGGPLDLPRLWLWQRRHKFLLVQTIGENAMALGRSVLRMRPPQTTLLSHAFLLRAPHEDVCAGKPLCAAHKIFCGSDHIRARIARGSGRATNDAAWHGPKNRTLPLGDCFVPVLPGMNFEGYEPQQHDEAPAPPEKAPSQAARFIFGMSDALAPRSGAIMVMRAMAAIWQRHDLPAWEVRACGGGPRFQEVLEEAENLGVQSRLCLLNEQDLPEMLRPCRAWIAPGSAPDETPETLGAGMAAGMPVICSRSPLHLQRLAAAPGAACLFEENNPQSLAEAMMRVMMEPALRRELVGNGEKLRPDLSFESFAATACAHYEAWCGQLGWLDRNENAAPQERA